MLVLGERPANLAVVPGAGLQKRERRLRLQKSPLDGVGVACAAVSLALAGCAGASVGGRPLIYKQGKGDAPSTISTQGGVVVKRETPEPAAATPAPAPAAAAPAARPAADSPRAATESPGYTQATRYGDLLFVSGQIAVDPASGDFDATQGIEAQTRQVMENIRSILESNRLTMANVVYATVYLSWIGNLSGMNREYHRYFKGMPPARVVVQAGQLPRGALVQIAVMAGR